MLNVIYDMETSDPDDAFTLCFLAGHRDVNLVAVTVTPGSQDQVNLIKCLLHWFNKEPLPVGARTPGYEKSAVSEFHYKWLGSSAKFQAAPGSPMDKEQYRLSSADVLRKAFTDYPNAVLLTGAALHNPRLLLEKYPDTIITRWVGQGGFAGDSLVAPEDRLPKFDGKETCPTFNFNGDVPGAKLLLSTENIKLRQLVSKNVCHGVVYDQALHQKLEPYRKGNVTLGMIYWGMSEYLKKNPQGKMFHDPLAACTMINPDICQFKEVEVYREKGEWGSKLKDGTNTFISVKADHQKFVDTLLGA